MEQQNFNAGLAYSDYKQAQTLYIVAALAAFLMSSYFMVSYATGGIPFSQWGATEWKYAITAVMVTGVMTGFQYRLYQAGNVDGAGKAGVLAVIVAVSFSLLSEVGQGMERDEVRMEYKSQESPTYKAIVGSLQSATTGTYNPYAADLQQAQTKLAQCEARLAQGKEKHCEGAKARVEAVNQMIANHNATTEQRALALADKAKTMEKDETNYFPLVGVIAAFLGVSGKVASLLFSTIVISMFEYAFHYLGSDFNKAREKLLAQGYDVTRKLRQPPRRFDGSLTTYQDGATPPLAAFADSAKMTVGEYAQKVEAGLKASPQVIAEEMARAQHARGQVYAKAAAKLDNLQSNPATDSQARFYKLLYLETRNRLINGDMQPSVTAVSELITEVIRKHTQVLGLEPHLISTAAREKIATGILAKLEKDGIVTRHNGAYQVAEKWQPNKPEILNSEGFKQTPAQWEMVNKLHEAQLKTYREELKAGKPLFADQALDAPVKPAQHPTPSSLDDAAQQPSDYARIAPETHSSDYARIVEVGSIDAQPSDYARIELTETAKQIEADLYPEWLASVKAGQITPAAQHCKRFISQATFNKGDKTVLSVQEMGRIWLSWQNRAANDGVLKANPKYQAGNRQPKYIIA